MCSSTKSPSESAPKTNNHSQESCHEHVDLLGGVYAYWFAEGSLLNVPSKRHISTGTLPSDPAVSGRLTSGGTHSLCLDCAQTSANPPPNTPITSNTASLEILENLGGVWGRLGERVPALRLLIRGSEAHQRLSCVRRSLRSRCMHHRHLERKVDGCLPCYHLREKYSTDVLGGHPSLRCRPIRVGLCLAMVSLAFP